MLSCACVTLTRDAIGRGATTTLIRTSILAFSIDLWIVLLDLFSRRRDFLLFFYPSHPISILHKLVLLG